MCVVFLLYHDMFDLTIVFWIQVAYKVPFSAHLKKPAAVAIAFIGLFVLAFTWKRVDVRIQTKP